MNEKIAKYTAIGIGGMVGAGFRYAASQAMPGSTVTSFPWDTVFVNWSGAFLLTLLLFSFFPKNRWQSVMLPALTTGIIGAYTTFSTIQLDFFILMETRFLLATAYLLFTIFGGLTASFLGYRVAQMIPRENEGEGYE